MHRCSFEENNRMSGLESNKNLAGIGSILLMFPVVSIVGIILLYIGIKGLSEYYKDESIYRNALRGVIYGIIALVAIAVAVPLFVIGGMFSVFTLGPFGIGLGLISLFLLAVIVFIFYVLAAMQLRKAFNSLAQKTGEHMFETAGTLLFVGAILTILFFIGLILIFIAWIIATISFFSIQNSQQPYGYGPATAPASSVAQSTRYCPNCGAPVDQNATFCSHCGKQLPPA
jgi:uncharacterized membrane protein